MTTNQFEIVDEQFISYYGGTGYLISNGECKFWLWHSKEETQKVCDKLNSILDENEQLKHRLAISKKANFVTTLEKENEQLKSENKKLNERIGILEGSLIDKGFDIND